MKTAALIGNPNVGKTSLFNSLTGSNQYVGNWAGVTVEKKEGFMNEDLKIVDLPGIYAMDTFSSEEKVAKEFLASGEADFIINIVDASNLERNLYLTTQIKEYNTPILLVLNMMDVAAAKGLEIDTELLSRKLGVTVVTISASKGKGLDELKSLLDRGDFLRVPIENDFQFQDEREAYDYISGILSAAVKKKDEHKRTNTEKIDKVALNKFLAYPLFFLILWLIFELTFSWVGQPLAGYLSYLVDDVLVPALGSLLSSSSPWFSSLIIDGIIGGVGSVIVFLPVIMTLFLGISFLEDCGYMARAAFIMDKAMRKMGLSGKAFIPMIVGFGCSVPGIMTARTLESEKDRKLTALLVPLMSCNARLPVYALFASVFFPGRESAVVFSLYLLGILLAFLLGMLFKRTIFKKDEEPFIIELPEYKAPELKNLMNHTWDKGKDFLKKAGTLIFSVSVVVWLLSNFNFGGMTDINNSILASLGGFVSPVFAPLGFASWQNAVSLITGLMAKEVVLGTMGVIYGGSLAAALQSQFTPASAYSFLVFVLLYTPCVSVIATMKKEFGSWLAAFSVTYQLVLAWIVSALVYRIALLVM
ncbi:MAG: ferrous iron transport protein [Firmicutes bacterium]|nr:ferrous iron transport protein [Bacillota bacterium]